MFFLSKLPIMHFSFFFFFFSQKYQQLKRVFKNVLYLAESIIRTFDFEKMNGLIEELFNLEGECNKQWNVKWVCIKIRWIITPYTMQVLQYEKFVNLNFCHVLSPVYFTLVWRKFFFLLHWGCSYFPSEMIDILQKEKKVRKSE